MSGRSGQDRTVRTDRSGQNGQGRAVRTEWSGQIRQDRVGRTSREDVSGVIIVRTSWAGKTIGFFREMLIFFKAQDSATHASEGYVTTERWSDEPPNDGCHDGCPDGCHDTCTGGGFLFRQIFRQVSVGENTGLRGIEENGGQRWITARYYNSHRRWTARRPARKCGSGKAQETAVTTELKSRK